MIQDPIVDDVRRVREKLAEKYGFDVKAILAAAKRRQRTSGFKVVSFATSKKYPEDSARRSDGKRMTSGIHTDRCGKNIKTRNDNHLDIGNQNECY